MELILRSGGKVLIDESDLALVAPYSWTITNNKRVRYAQATVGGKFAYMHKLIMRPPRGLQVDHINGDGLDNRRSNLRIVTNQQNSYNQPKRRNALSKYKGVSYDNTKAGKVSKKWRARIKNHGKVIRLGRFRTEEDAALAYNIAAQKYFGQYARLNVLAGSTPPPEGGKNA